jgi:gluconate 2-dehydrogenase gamma chain
MSGYLTAPEIRFLDAAVARLIPADELGPGAKEARVTTFIDRQLCSSYGVMARGYRMGPWFEGTPQQGWQTPLTPQEVYREAIREIDAYCTKQFRAPFGQLKAEQQDAILTDLQNDKIELHSVNAKVFFDLLLKNTMEGFFADPIHGGNHEKIGWKLIGFPGIASSDYTALMATEHDNQPYRVEPVSILDVVENKAKTDAQGYAIHKRIDDAAKNESGV